MKDNLKTLGASNLCNNERELNDFYTTDEDCVRELLKVESFEHTILEPCCGTGNISKVLEDVGYHVISTDLIDRGYGKGNVDFFKEYTKIETDLITNPPFGLATDFVEHALKYTVGKHKIALFLKLQFLEGQDRYNKIYSQKKLKKIYVFSKRVACYKGNEKYQRNDDGSFKMDRVGNLLKVQSAVCYAWLIFETDYNGLPQLDWVNLPEETK